MELDMLTMKKLHQMYAFHPDTLAYRANVPEAIVVAMLKDLPVPQEYAEKVLSTLSNQTGQPYTLHNVSVVLRSHKISFIELRNLHHFDIPELAWYAEIEPVLFIRCSSMNQ